jgi:hypothetical protein
MHNDYIKVLSMINATLVKINRLDTSSPKVTDKNQQKKYLQGMLNDAMLVDTGWNFTVLKQIPLKTQIKAFSTFSTFINKIKKEKTLYGLMVHPHSHVSMAEDVMLFYVNEQGGIEKSQIANPLWKSVDGVKRNITNRGFELEPSTAMQSQLFAMLDSAGGDDHWMQLFQLKDRQQSKMYQWQDDNFDKKNNMNISEMLRLSQNVLNVARLPPLIIHFKEDGNACMFAISRSGGKTLTVETQDGKKDDTQWGWLAKANEDKFEKVGDLPAEYKLRISDMRLEMVMSWAMNAHILLHELAHYIQFIQPTPYRLNRGEVLLNFNEYEEIFAGHGAAYMAVFSRLLIDFYHVNEESLYDSIREAELLWFPIKSVKVSDITEGITKYCKRNKN